MKTGNRLWGCTIIIIVNGLLMSKMITILGPTASGKTGLAVALAAGIMVVTSLRWPVDRLVRFCIRVLRRPAFGTSGEKRKKH